MKYKKAKEIVINNFVEGMMFGLKFGWKFRIYPRLRRQMKQWADEILNETSDG